MRRLDGPSPKNLDSDENLKPYFVTILRFVANYNFLEDLGQESAFLGQKHCLLVYIALLYGIEFATVP